MSSGINDLELDSVGANPNDRTSTRGHVDLPSTGGMDAVKSIFGPANRKRLITIGILTSVALGSFAWSIYSVKETDGGGGQGQIDGATARTHKNSQPTQAQRDEGNRYNEEVLPVLQKDDPTAHPVVVTEDSGEFKPTREFARPDKFSEVGNTSQGGRTNIGGGSGAQPGHPVKREPASKESMDLLKKLAAAEGQDTPTKQVVSWAYQAPQAPAAQQLSKNTGNGVGYDDYGSSGQLAGELPATCKNPIIRAGHQYVARSTMALNSDVGGPVIVELVNGPLRKHRLTGAFERKDEWMRMSFNSLVGIKDPKKVTAIGLDMDTVLNAVGGDVDYHTMYRFGWWGLGTVLSAIGKAAEKNADTQTVFVGDNAVTDTASDTSREIKMALGDLGQSIGDVMRDRINRPLTVSLKVNDLVGIVFMDDVCGDK